MKTSTMIILGGAAVGVYLLLKSGTAKASTVMPGKVVTTLKPGINFANAASQFFADPRSFVSQVNYYTANPNAQPWDIFKLSI